MEGLARSAKDSSALSAVVMVADPSSSSVAAAAVVTMPLVFWNPAAEITVSQKMVSPPSRTTPSTFPPPCASTMMRFTPAQTKTAPPASSIVGMILAGISPDPPRTKNPPSR